MKPNKVSFEVESGRYEGETRVLISLKDTSVLVSLEEALLLSDMIRKAVERTKTFELLLEYLKDKEGVNMPEEVAMFMVVKFGDWVNKKEETDNAQ